MEDHIRPVGKKHKRQLLIIAFFFLLVQLAFERFHIGIISVLEKAAASSPASSSFEEDRPYPFFKPHPFTFSACLMIKDQNIILPEWLAYHYTFLPLRRLIVGVDPISKTDPTWILNKYRSIGMNITMWRRDTNNYKEYWKKGNFSNPWNKKLDERYSRMQERMYDKKTLHEQHRLRQRSFYSACLRKLKDEGRTWTAVVDADEYVNFNFYHEREGEPGYCRDDKACITAYEESMRNGTHFRARLNASNTVAEHISRGYDPWFQSSDKSCIVLARFLFISTKESDDERMPPGFNISYFHTIRYRHRTTLHQLQPGKSIVDASRYNGAFMSNPHRLYNGTACTGTNVYVHNSELSFRVHHYVGSWESFRRPGFDSRGWSTFSDRNKQKHIEVDNVAWLEKSLWLSDFVIRVGREKALELTQQLRMEAELEMGKVKK